MAVLRQPGPVLRDEKGDVLPRKADVSEHS